MHRHSEVFRTARGTPYLKSPGVVLLAATSTCLDDVDGFLVGFDEELLFRQYLDDLDAIDPASELCKFAGQLCYMSLGPKRTMNADAQKYFDNIKESAHGSVLEHASFSFLFYGQDRAATHEEVRHRAGFAFSQVSQRYVDGKTLRFVERPEYQGSPRLHALFEERIDRAVAEYDAVAEVLREEMGQALAGKSRTDARKAVNQAARSLLPNETEACIVVTANARAWRHFVEMRDSRHADAGVRPVADAVLGILKQVAPPLFDDYVPDESGVGVTTRYRKV